MDITFTGVTQDIRQNQLDSYFNPMETYTLAQPPARTVATAIQTGLVIPNA